MAVPCLVAVAATVSSLSFLGQAAAYATTSVAPQHQVGAAPSSRSISSPTAGLSTCSPVHMRSSSSSFEIGLQRDAPAHRCWHGWRGGGGRRVAQAQRQAHSDKTPLIDDEEDAQSTAGGRSVVPYVTDTTEGDGTEMSLLDQLLARGAEATKSGGATESSHTGSSEWAGFKTAPDLLEV